MTFWDGTRWVPEPSPAQPSPSPVQRLREMLATGVMVAVLGATALPFIATTAAGPELTASPGTAAVDHVRVRGTNFPPRSRVQITWDGSFKRLPTAWVNRNGSFSATITVPSAARGDHTIAAVEVATSVKVVRRASQLDVVLAGVAFAVEGDPVAAAPTPDPIPRCRPRNRRRNRRQSPALSRRPRPAPFLLLSSTAPSTAPERCAERCADTGPQPYPYGCTECCANPSPNSTPVVSPSPAATPPPSASPTPVPTATATPAPTPVPVATARARSSRRSTGPRRVA